ncbi:MAG TPA: RES family NAD+ phosphorylase [Vicinamibacterales bacterium]|nr:RES family NAD+ phosphorylase [Vicinamibacterales bacterium]
MARVPPLALVRQFDTHRLVPSKYSAGGDSALARIADDDDHLQAIFALDAATNDRLLAQHQRFLGIGVEEMVVGVPFAHVVNAPFCHPHPLGSRFNGPDRGAWYAGFALATSQAEVAVHKQIELAETGWDAEESITYDDYLSDVSAVFHDLRRAPGFRGCLAPASYVASQALAERLLDAGSLGVVYPSVRHAGGTCVACFRPALVTNVRRDATYRFTFAAGEAPGIVREPARPVITRRRPAPTRSPD